MVWVELVGEEGAVGRVGVCGLGWTSRGGAVYIEEEKLCKS